MTIARRIPSKSCASKAAVSGPRPQARANRESLFAFESAEKFDEVVSCQSALPRQGMGHGFRMIGQRLGHCGSSRPASVTRPAPCAGPRGLRAWQRPSYQGSPATTSR